MEGLAPPLQCLLDVRLELENGQSVRAAVQTYIRHHSHEEFARALSLWLSHLERGLPWESSPVIQRSLYRQMLLEILAQGINGASILERLRVLEDEILRASELELQEHLTRLPFLLLIPLLLFQFPALLLLLLGPLLKEFLERMQT